MRPHRNGAAVQPIDPDAVEQRRARITALFAEMVRHADDQSRTRCPYKDRHDCCTAAFGCRNQRRAPEPGGRLRCAADDRLDYRSAWEAEPHRYAEVRGALRQSAAAGRAKDERTMSADVLHEGQRCPAAMGTSIFDCADKLALHVPSSCGRSGHCHECVVEIRRGAEALSPPTEAEAFLSGNFRLACQATVQQTNREVEFALLRRTPQILTAPTSRETELDPAVRVRGAQVFYGDEAIDTFRGAAYGLAVDVGTTTMVAELVDLLTGQPACVTAFENPQRFGGSDVMNRISYDAGPYKGELHAAVIRTLNGEIQAMCKRLGIQRHVIYEVVVVGNATMRELFLGLDVQSIGERPYKSAVEQAYRAGLRASTAMTVPARKLGLRAHRNARVFAAPLIASHVGGDVAADLVAMDMASQDDVVMLVDVGTNTEVVIGNRDRMLAASCPAGPAFEGGPVTFGMPGCDGAIESIRCTGVDADGPHFTWRTIGDGPPQGICGSGLIDLLAELVRHDLMTPKGVFADKARQFTIDPATGITISRRDVSELAQAKAANTCGQRILMRRLGVRPDGIKRLYLAGGFASYVDPDSAIDIGFLAPVPPERIIKLGNAAARGARELLLSRGKRDAVEQLIERIEHVELETTADFFNVFVDACQIKPIPAEP